MDTKICENTKAFDKSKQRTVCVCVLVNGSIDLQWHVVKNAEPGALRPWFCQTLGSFQPSLMLGSSKELQTEPEWRNREKVDTAKTHQRAIYEELMHRLW